MSDHRDLLRFGILAVAIYVALLVPWPGLGEAFGSAYRAELSWLRERLAPYRTVRVVALRMEDSATAPEWRADTGLILRYEGSSGAPPRRVPMLRSSHYTGLAPMALVAALVLATPLRWGRRGVALLVGLVLANGFVMAMALLQIRGGFADLEAAAGSSPRSAPAAWLRSLLGGLDDTGGWMGPYYVVPVGIWLVVVARRTHWPPWRRRMSEPGPAGESSDHPSNATH